MVLEDVRDKAVKLAMEYERKLGRNPKEVRNVGYDIYSDGLKIEVKGRTKAKRPQVLFNEQNINACEKERGDYRLYIVMDVHGDNPFLIILNADQVKKIHREKRQWEIPIYAEHYKNAIKLT